MPAVVKSPIKRRRRTTTALKVRKSPVKRKTTRKSPRKTTAVRKSSRLTAKTLAALLGSPTTIRRRKSTTGAGRRKSAYPMRAHVF